MMKKKRSNEKLIELIHEMNEEIDTSMTQAKTSLDRFAEQMAGFEKSLAEFNKLAEDKE